MAKNNQSQSKNGTNFSLEAQIEAILFVTPTAVTIKQLSDSIGASEKLIEKSLDLLKDNLSTRGIRLQKNRGKYQLTSAPEAAPAIENLLNLETTAKLTAAAIETLAIIAYQQPITRPAVDAVRGVNSDGVLRNLLSKGLVEESGRSEGPGRPILYVTSSEFLQFFGLSSIKDLPPLDIPEIPQEETSKEAEIQNPLPLKELSEE